MSEGETFLDRTAAELTGEQGAGCLPFDLSGASVRALLSTIPPERKYLVRDILPANVVGLFAAAGGTGKSFGVLQLAVSLATGSPWLGLPVGIRGSTLIVSAEDDRTEIHRRLLAVVEHNCMGMDEDEKSTARDVIGSNVFIIDRVGNDNRLTAQVDRELIRTGMAARISATAQAMDDPPVLIVLDPLSRFDGGEPNANDDGTRLIECAETIRRETGATILLPHHVNKASIRDASAGQEAIRGASGLVDGARWVGLMATLQKDDAKKYAVERENASRYVRFDVVKGNYGPPFDGQWLERGPGGVLMPTELRESRQVANDQRQEATYRHIVEAVTRLIRKHGPMSARHIRDNYAGQAGLLKAGDKAVRAALARAVEERHLYEVSVPGGPGKRLELRPGDE